MLNWAVDYRNIHFCGSHRAAKRPASARPLVVVRHSESETAVDPVIRRVMELAGLNVADYQAKALNRRTSACLRLLRRQSSEEAIDLLERDRSLVPLLTGTLLLGVTEFFRDKQVFSSIEKRVLPAILERTTRPAIWSAACSDGHELYSVAMLLGRVHGLEQAYLLGTDCRQESISAAAAGVYPIAAAESIPSEFRRAWVLEQRDRFHISPQLRDRISWQVSDLLNETPPGRWHLVLWRNMAIYLAQPAADRAWMSILGALEPGGFLVTGKAERPPAHLKLVRCDTCIYQKPAA